MPSLVSLRSKLLACDDYGQFLKRCKSNVTSTRSCEDSRFFDKLSADVEGCNRVFQRLARKFLWEFMAADSGHVSSSCFWIRGRAFQDDNIEHKPAEEDACTALEFYQVAQATLECLRRVITAYDVICQSASGHRFYQSLMARRLPNTDFSFFNAAILLEFQSIYLLTPQGSKHMDFNTGGDFEGRFDAQEASRCLLSCDGNTPHCSYGCRACKGDCGVLPQHQCPICMDVIFEALALECGHVFCATCALKAANKGRAVGTIRAILDHVEHSQACPLCRKQGVHAMARQLPLTDRILEQRYPEAHAAQRLRVTEEREALLMQLRLQKRAAR
ncbi:g469 [Coccomyxa elongata]